MAAPRRTHADGLPPAPAPDAHAPQPPPAPDVPLEAPLPAGGPMGPFLSFEPLPAGMPPADAPFAAGAVERMDTMEEASPAAPAGLLFPMSLRGYDRDAVEQFTRD